MGYPNLERMQESFSSIGWAHVGQSQLQNNSSPPPHYSPLSATHCNNDFKKIYFNKLLSFCSSSTLQENGLQALMKLFNSFIHEKKKGVPSEKIHGWHSSSRVIVDELGAQLKKEYAKFCENPNLFKWDRTRPLPPRRCEEAQCSFLSDSEDSDFEESSDSSEEVEEGITKNKQPAKGTARKRKGISIQPDQHEKKRKFTNRKDIDFPPYGNGYSDQFVEGLNVTAKFCLSKIFNLLWLIPWRIPGFHTSYLFYGTSHTIFPVHVEDGLTYSMNYLYVGLPKVW